MRGAKLEETFEGWRVTALCRPKYSFGHNLRLADYVETQKHIDPKRPHEVLLHMGDERETYQAIFGESIKKYNAKQKRKDRRITDYYQKVLDDERAGTHKNPKASAERKPFYEFQFYIGNRDSHCPDEKAKKVLSLYVQKILPKKFPNFIPTSITGHNDEFSFDRKGNRVESPYHLHVVGVFVAHALSAEELKEENKYRAKCKEAKKAELAAKGIAWDESKWKKTDWRKTMIDRWGKSLEKGMELQCSMSAACNEMGFFTTKGKGTAQQQFEEAVRHDLMDFCESMGIKINRTKGYSHSHKEKEIYAAEQDNFEKEKELSERQELIDAKELEFENRKDDFDYTIEHLEETKKSIDTKTAELALKEKQLQKLDSELREREENLSTREDKLIRISEETKRRERIATGKEQLVKSELEQSEKNRKQAMTERKFAEQLLEQNQNLVDSYNSENREKLIEIKNWTEAAAEITDTTSWLKPLFIDYQKNRIRENAISTLFSKVANGVKAVIAKVKQTYDKKLDALNKKLFGYKRIYSKGDSVICEYNYGEADYADMLRDTPVSEIEKAIAETRRKGKRTFAEAAAQEKGFAFYERYFEKAKTLTRERKIALEREQEHSISR